MFKTDALLKMMDTDWAVGFNDRGMGHGDYAVIVAGTDNDVVVKCPSREVAEHIVAAHRFAQLHYNVKETNDVLAEGRKEGGS